MDIHIDIWVLYSFIIYMGALLSIKQQVEARSETALYMIPLK